MEREPLISQLATVAEQLGFETKKLREIKERMPTIDEVAGDLEDVFQDAHDH